MKKRNTLLSRREKEVLHQLSLGHTSRQIAQNLGITELTAQTHRRNMLKKLKLLNTQQLMAWGYQQKLLE